MEKENKKTTEIPFGAKGSELHKFEYTIPEGYEARIEDGKVIVKKKESEDERIYNLIYSSIKNEMPIASPRNKELALAYLEKQKENVEKEYVFRPLAGTDITTAAEQSIRKAKEGEHLILAFNGMYTPVSKYDSAKGLVDKYNTCLEKQKEQKPVSVFTFDDILALESAMNIAKHDNDSDLYNALQNIFERVHDIYHGEVSKPAERLSREEYVKKFKALCDAYEIKLPNREYDIYGLCEDLHKLFGDIQKPAEWSDTDMNEARNNLISVCRDWERGKQTTLLPIVAVRARYFLEHLTEPKPAEWSEEFLRLMGITISQDGNQVCVLLGENLAEGIAGFGDTLADAVEEFKKEWRQFDRFRKATWKPSMEQMEALKDAFRKDGGNEYRKVINSLYNDLQKLL